MGEEEGVEGEEGEEGVEEGEEREGEEGEREGRLDLLFIRDTFLPCFDTCTCMYGSAELPQRLSW